MNQKTLTVLLGCIVFIFISRGVICDSGHEQTLENFFILLGVLFLVIVHPIFIPKQKKPSNKELLDNLRKLKKKSNLEKNSV